MIFLLGGNGFVGSGMSRALKARGLPFVTLTRENYTDFAGQRCDLFINANGNSSKILGREDPKLDFQASVASVRNTLCDFKFDRYLFLSTSDIYPDCSSPAITLESSKPEPRQQSPYGFHKYLAEQLVQHAAPDWTIVRQGGFVGPGLKKNAVYDVLNGDRIWVHPASRFQYIHVDDSANAILDLLERAPRNEVFNLTARGTIAVEDVMAMTGRQCSAPAEAKPAVYEISTEKDCRYVELPETRDCVERYLAELGVAL